MGEDSNAATMKVEASEAPPAATEAPEAEAANGKSSDDKSSIRKPEEAALRDRLERKIEEKRLKESLIAKKRLSKSDHNNNGDNNTDNKGSNTEKNRRGASRGASSNSRERRSTSMEHRNGQGPYNNNHRRGGPGDRPHYGGGGGRGPPPPGGWGGYPPQRGDDPYGRNNNPSRGHYYQGRPAVGYGPPPPPGHRDHPQRGGGPPGPPAFYDEDQYGRAPRRHHHRPSSRSRSRSISRSYSSRRSRSPASSRSRSHSRSSRSPDSRSKRSRSEDRSRGGGRRRKHHRRRSSRGRRRSPSSSGSSISSSSSSSSSSDDESDREGQQPKKKTTTTSAQDNLTKDQRTVFVNQLVMRTTSKDIRNYFRKKVGAKVNEVILLKDRRTGKHKGCAYVEMKSMEDVTKALNVSGQPPDFQRFPILVKPSEAEKNYMIPASSATVTANGKANNAGPLVGPNGQLIESQKVYVGSLDPSVSQDHLFQLFSQFGDLTKVSLQMDPNSGQSKGYAFLSFRDPKEANLAIQTMSNQVLAGRGMKTGWATMANGTPGLQVVTSEEFPEDASARAQKAHTALAQLAMGASVAVVPPPAAVASLADAALNAAMGGGSQGIIATATTAVSGSKVPTVAEARQILATNAASGMMAAVPSVASTFPGVATTAAVLTPTAASLAAPDAKVIGRADNPSPHLLVHNMYDKDEETEEGWAEEIKLEFQDECSKFGKIEHVLVMSKEPGGKIYVSFSNTESAKSCASSLAGRWFDKRQLRVQFLDQDEIPKEA